jgi:hypothetical protein
MIVHPVGAVMRAFVLDLDGSVAGQPELLSVLRPQVLDLRRWGPKLRLGCSRRRFTRFEHDLELPTPRDGMLTFLGSGDFHHATLAILRRIGEPFNLAVIDAEPDWRGGLPGLGHHNWLSDALTHTQARRIYHLGASRWRTPDAERQRLLGEGTIIGLPLFDAGAAFRLGEPLRTNGYQRCRPRRMQALLEVHREELRRRPLYISVDKTALVGRHAEVNGESGGLWRCELFDLLRCLIDMSGDLLAIDVAGDWSPRIVSGFYRRGLAVADPAPWHVDPGHARQINKQTNLMLLAQVLDGQRAGRLAA